MNRSPVSHTFPSPPRQVSLTTLSPSTQSPLGNYELICEIARGGMANVDLFKHKNAFGIERKVVIKQVLSSLQERTQLHTMFIDEARLMMEFNHPHLARIFEVGSYQNRPFLAMEYIHGPTLRDILQLQRQTNTPVPRSVALGIALGLTQALDYLHHYKNDQGQWLSIIHRDLKPSNILISLDGVVKLIDFGIAHTQSKLHHTQTGVVKGTIGYLAPEQVKGDGVFQKSDVFNLGILLFQLFLGRYPFMGNTDAQRLQSLVRGQVIETEYQGLCSERLYALLMHCLSIEVDQRPTMRDIIKVLTQECAHQGHIPTFVSIASWIQHYQWDLPDLNPVRSPVVQPLYSSAIAQFDSINHIPPTQLSAYPQNQFDSSHPKNEFYSPYSSPSHPSYSSYSYQSSPSALSHPSDFQNQETAFLSTSHTHSSRFSLFSKISAQYTLGVILIFILLCALFYSL